MKKGLFIVVDSGEGAGKTTQLENARKFFGDKIVVTREPGGSPYAEEIRSLILNSKNASQADAKTLFALFWAARADHLKNTIIPALENGKTVVCDRFDSTTFAYQIVAQGSKDWEEFFWQTRDFYLGDIKPDLYVYFDLDPKIGIARKNNQGPDERNHIDERSMDFHNKGRAGFKEFMKKVPHKIINAEQPVEKVWDDFRKVLESEIKKR